MAAAFLTHLAGDPILVRSADSALADQLPRTSTTAKAQW